MTYNYIPVCSGDQSDHYNYRFSPGLMATQSPRSPGYEVDGDVESLQQTYEGLLNRVRAARKCSLAELLSPINSSEFTLSRNFSVEHFVPNYARGREKKCFTAIR